MALLTSGVGFYRPAAMMLALASLFLPPLEEEVLDMNDMKMKGDYLGRLEIGNWYDMYSGSYSHKSVPKFYVGHREKCTLNPHI